MFEYLADDIVIFLIQRKIIDAKDRDLYCYGAEVFFLNILNIIIAVLITIFSGTWSHFLIFMMIFVPLRISIGGYHAKTSQVCLIQSTILYIATVALVKYYPYIYQSVFLKILVAFSVVSIIIFAPIEHINNPLGKKSRKKNRIISISLAILDSIIFVILAVLDCKVASSIMTFIIIAALLMILGKICNIFSSE